MLFALALTMLAWLNVKPAEALAAAGNDAGVISVIANDDNTVTATLYGYSGSAATDVSFYRDGEKVDGSTNIAVAAGKRVKATSAAAIVLEDEDVHYYTVVISDDDNCSNNNRTLIRGKDSGTTEPVDPIVPEDPKEAELSVTCLPVTAVAGDAVNEITVQINNTGDAPATNVQITVTVDGQTFTGGVDSVAANTSLDVKLSGNWTPGAAGNYTVSAVVTADDGAGAADSGSVTVQQPSESETGVKSPTVTQSGTTFTTVTLSWGYDDASDGEIPTEYTIEIDGRTMTKTAPGTEVITGLAAGTSYTYTVTAKNGSTVSAVSGSVTTRSDSEKVSGIDIVVSDIIWEPANPVTGDQVTFKAVITNQGKNDSNGKKHGVRFYIDDVTNGQSCTGNKYFWSDQYQDSLAAGQSVVVTANGNYNMENNWWSAAAGSHKVTAYVDDSGIENITGDSNRSNNSLTKELTVAAVLPAVEIPVDTANSENIIVAEPGSYGDKENSSISVLVNGKASACLDAWVNTSRLWDRGYYETTPVTIFEMKEENVGAIVRVALPASKRVNDVIVRPLSSNIQAKIVPYGSGSYVEFQVNKWGSYSVEFNGETSGALQVFVNPEYKNGQYGGKYLPLGTITWDAAGFEGTVYGSGILCSSHQGAVISPGNGARYYGVTILNEYKAGYGGNGSWEVQLLNRSDVEFNYFHIIACSPNSDGISVQSSGNIRVNNCYFRTWDDGIALKNYSGGNTNNIYLNNCVFWTDLAQSMEIGAETNKQSDGGNSDPKIYTVYFENIDVIHSCHKPAISIHNMDNAAVSDVHWKNVTIEDASMGNNYDYGDGWPIVIDLGTYKGGTVPGTDAGWTHVSEFGSISNVTLDNIKVLSYTNSDALVENLVTGDATGKAPGIRVRGVNISNITIKDLYIGDTKIDSWTKARSEMRVVDTTDIDESSVTFQ